MRWSRSFIDCHVHLGGLDEIAHLVAMADRTGAEYMNIVCTFSREQVNANPAAFIAKAQHPDRFFIFAGLDHSSFFMAGKTSTPSLPEQIDRLIAIGADGIKMLENKPTHRKLLDVPVDGPYFREYFSHLEETGLPVLWHVCDPEEFWVPELTPKWAAERGWGYDETFVPKEQLYSEVERVLARHPRLKIIFAHFYFLSADLPRAAAFLDRFPQAFLDLAPGIEYLYNMSRDVHTTRNFFMKYADRIVFGTDIWSGMDPRQAEMRAGIINRWLETDDEYRVPEGADHLLGPPEDGVMRGLALPSDVLDMIYRGNFERLVGAVPRQLDRALAAKECERTADEVRILGGDVSHAAQAASFLSSSLD